MSADLTDRQIAQVEEHIAFEGIVHLRKWIDTSAHGFKITLDLLDRGELDGFDGVMAMRKSRGGQRYHAIITPYVPNIDHGLQPDGDAITQQEWQFAGRGWSETQGAHIAIHLGDLSAISYWRQQMSQDQLEAERTPGRFDIILLELSDEETVVNQEKRSRVIPPTPPKGGPRSKAVARLIQDPEFRQWMNWGSIHHVGPQGERDAKERDRYIKSVCGFESKIELDHGNEAAWQKWETQFHRPFIQYMQRQS